KSIDLRLERARRLGELGAALFHRLCLEGDALKTREMETQLSIAATIQSRLIPTQPPQSETLTFSWQSNPADYVGGDYLDLLDDSNGTVHAIIADVSGHGINSALLMASCRAAYRADCRRVEPGKLMEILNNEVHNEVGDTGMFITAASLKLADDGTCTYASAGHNPLFLFRAATKTVEQLDSTGPSLGFFPGMEFGTESILLEPGDCLLLYTDGIVEATNAQGEMFGEVRLADALIEHADKNADSILWEIHVAMHKFLDTAKCDDDVSSAVIKRAACA
ncbi:MAG: serine/threonine-protein phosphatase, partial [Planctomycetes bacterium]|nr:serine/threonine-protein phosphatase [Planctomycetota bacterium]